MRDGLNYEHQAHTDAFNNLEKIEEDETLGTPIQSRRGSVMGSRAGSMLSLNSTSSFQKKGNMLEKRNLPKKLKSQNLPERLQNSNVCQGQSFYSEVSSYFIISFSLFRNFCRTQVIHRTDQKDNKPQHFLLLRELTAHLESC